MMEPHIDFYPTKFQGEYQQTIDIFAGGLELLDIWRDLRDVGCNLVVSGLDVQEAALQDDIKNLLPRRGRA